MRASSMSFVLKPWSNKWVWSAVGIVFGAGVTGAVSYQWRRAQVATDVNLIGAHCDDGIGNARRRTEAAAGALPAAASLQAAEATTAWIPRINDSIPPEPAPGGMVWVPGGQFWMGAQEDHMPD